MSSGLLVTPRCFCKSALPCLALMMSLKTVILSLRPRLRVPVSFCFVPVCLFCVPRQGSRHSSIRPSPRQVGVGVRRDPPPAVAIPSPPAGCLFPGLPLPQARRSREITPPSAGKANPPTVAPSSHAGVRSSPSPPFVGDHAVVRGSPSPPFVGDHAVVRSSPSPPFVGDHAVVHGSPSPPFAGDHAVVRGSPSPPFVGDRVPVSSSCVHRDRRPDLNSKRHPFTSFCFPFSKVFCFVPVCLFCVPRQGSRHSSIRPSPRQVGVGVRRDRRESADREPSCLPIAGDIRRRLWLSQARRLVV